MIGGAVVMTDAERTELIRECHRAVYGVGEDRFERSEMLTVHD